MANNSGRIVFIIGSSRSGTTMLSRMLGLHTEIFTFQELHFFETIWDQKGSDVGLSVDDASDILARLITIQEKTFFFQAVAIDTKRYAKQLIMSEIGKEGFIDAISVYKLFLQKWCVKNNKRIPCEQTPRYSFYLEEIYKYFPNAVVINMVRDPRGVLLSQKNRWRRRKFSSYDMPFLEMVRLWGNYHPIITMQLWNAAVSKPISSPFAKNGLINIRYEDLLTTPHETLQEICELVGISYEDDMMRVPQIGSSLSKDTEGNLGIDLSKVNSWRGKLNKTEIFMVQYLTKKMMHQYGYNIEDIKPNMLSLLTLFVSFPFKIILAFLLNLKRIKNVKDAILRRL